MTTIWSLIEEGAHDWFVTERDRSSEKGGGMPSIAGVAACSTAISQKRIADALERIAVALEPQIIQVKIGGGGAGDIPK